MALDLKAYLKRYHEMGKLSHDFSAIEKRFSSLRDGRKWLTPEDVSWVLHPDNAPFGYYWPVPNKKILDHLSRKRLCLCLRSLERQDRKDVVKALLEVVKDLGVTSIILRFVHPECFGVFSHPVLSVLLVSRMSTLDLYVAYCEELSEYKSHFGLSSVAEVEMAITGLYEIMKGEYGQKESEAAQRAFNEEIWVQQKRGENVVGPFLRNFGKLQLAKILVKEDAELAGMIAGVEFERRLGLASKEFRHQNLTFDRDAIPEFLDWLRCEKKISGDAKHSLDRVKRIRNSAAHGVGARPTGKEVSWMISEIEKICNWKFTQNTGMVG